MADILFKMEIEGWIDKSISENIIEDAMDKAIFNFFNSLDFDYDIEKWEIKLDTKEDAYFTFYKIVASPIHEVNEEFLSEIDGKIYKMPAPFNDMFGVLRDWR